MPRDTLSHCENGLHRNPGRHYGRFDAEARVYPAGQVSIKREDHPGKEAVWLRVGVWQTVGGPPSPDEVHAVSLIR